MIKKALNTNRIRFGVIFEIRGGICATGEQECFVKPAYGLRLNAGLPAGVWMLGVPQALIDKLVRSGTHLPLVRVHRSVCCYSIKKPDLTVYVA